MKDRWSIFYMLERERTMLFKVANSVLWVWILFHNNFGYLMWLSLQFSFVDFPFGKHKIKQAWEAFIFPSPLVFWPPHPPPGIVCLSTDVSRLESMEWCLKNPEITTGGLYFMISESLLADVGLWEARREQEVWQEGRGGWRGRERRSFW